MTSEENGKSCHAVIYTDADVASCAVSGGGHCLRDLLRRSGKTPKFTSGRCAKEARRDMMPQPGEAPR